VTAIRVGLSDQDGFSTPDLRVRRALLDRVAAAGLDHVTVGDHISFHGGTGFDGMITASTLLAAHDRLPVLIGVYLLGLRHPMLVARQLATLAQTAPGRLILGVGAAGEDRSEVSNAGVDPATRGPPPRRGSAAAPAAAGRPGGQSRGRVLPAGAGPDPARAAAARAHRHRRPG
jgi:alkanesulfonate monooxygenase SsuD/methylene tetrahydromethanopterin reductase-like flavin-dependent oxidoreductase (luciferase family)